MTPKTLADFLLARIVEKEELAASAPLRPHIGDCQAYWLGADNETCTCDYSSRVLAECKAEREIIHAALHGFVVEQLAPGPGIEGYTVALYEVLKILASVHRNHPDYPEEPQP